MLHPVSNAKLPLPPSFFQGLSTFAAHPLAFWCRVVFAVAATSQCFAGRGQPRLWLILAALPPLLLALMDTAFRRRQLHAMARLWNCLSQPTMDSRVWLACFVFVAAPAVVVSVATPYYHIDSGDSWPVIPTAASLIREGNVELGEYLPITPREYWTDDDVFEHLPYCVRQIDGRICSRYPVGMTALALPILLVGQIGGADLDNPNVLSALDRWTAICVAAVALTLFTRLALCFTTRGAAVVAGWFLALGSGFFSTVSQSCWQHGGVAIGLLAVLLLESHPTWKASRWTWLGHAAAVGLMFACRLSSGALVPVCLIWIARNSPKRALVFGASALLGVLPWAAFYWVNYGTPLGPAQAQLNGHEWQSGSWNALAGLLFSPARGLVVYQPWAVLSLVGAVAYWRDRMTILCSALVTVHVILIACWSCWWGGSCWGSRLLTEILPPLMLLALRPIEQLLRFRAGRIALALLFVLAALSHISGVWCFGLSKPWLVAPPQSLWASPDWSALR